MKIAILSFGAIFAEKVKGNEPWKCGGPNVPLEFSRIGANGRLSLVIDQTNGQNNNIFYFPVESPDIDSLVGKIKQSDKNAKNVGWLDVKNVLCCPESARRPKIIKNFDNWCKNNKFDGAVWKDDGPKFSSVVGKPFSVAVALEYLKKLKLEEETYHYMQKFPISIKTPLKLAIIGEDFEIVDGI
jgi:hypothetical protein